MSDKSPIDVVLGQIESARDELAVYPPTEFDWLARCRESANLLVPWLTTVAQELKTFVEEVLNSRKLVRESWSDIKSAVGDAIPRHLVEAMDRELEREAILLENVGGDITSKVIERFLIGNFSQGELESNGRSDYPDLFIRSKPYEGLPTFKRIKDKTKEYGAALKGKKKRPVRVPDGLEIKTCRERFAVDCHHAHAGLHLALLFHVRRRVVEVTDIMVAFMRHEDYRITTPSTPTTTLKASFNGSNFVSILPSEASNS